MISPSSNQLHSNIVAPPQTSSILSSRANADLLKLQVQAVLEELRKNDLLPFDLEAWVVVPEDSHHTIRFYDSRLYSITVICEAGESFTEMVRAAVLERVSRLK